MDTSIIYTKTARGVLEIKNGGKNLSSALMGILKQIDGRSAVGSHLVNLEPQAQKAYTDALTALESKGFIKIFTRRALGLEAAAEGAPLEFEPALPTVQIEELSAEEGVLAWAEARRGARELVQLGFYATAHIDADGNITHRRDILIVEDDEAIAQLMKVYLSRKGFNVTTVADGQDALNTLDARPLPHLVLLDVNLPSVNGFDILAYIRSQEELKGMPAIMVTAQVSDADVLRGMKLGADGYIFKPFEWSVLHDGIKRVLGIKE